MYNPDLLSNHPVITRDISMFVPGNVSWATIQEIIREYAGRYMTCVVLVEVFNKGEPSSHRDCARCKQKGFVKVPDIPDGFLRSMFIRLTYQHTERTLTNQEVNAWHSLAVHALEKKGCRLR